MWSLIPPPIKAAMVMGALLALFAGYLYLRHQAYQDGYRDAEIVCEQEKADQAEANQKAISEVEKRLFEAADRLSIQNMEIDNALAELDKAASADPDGDDVCLPPRSVQRLNFIR